jgi:hypothetical protein
MKNTIKPKLLPFVGRFAIIHLIAYTAIAYGFLLYQQNLPESNRIGLDLYQQFRTLNITTILGQLLRGLAFGFVFYPFYDLVFERKGGKLLLFLSMWAVGLIGSVEPQPGSIEGVIYTIISLTEHTSVIIAIALQMAIFVGLAFGVENFINGKRAVKIGKLFLPNSDIIKGYIIRFVAVHLFTYWVVGGIFYEISGYNQALESMDIFALWRPLENLNAVLLVFFGQIFRGTMLALLLYPFYRTYIVTKRGWALLYLLMVGLTILGSPLFLTEFIAFEGSTAEFFKSLTMGIPEILSQMLVFSLLFFYWQKKAETKQMKVLQYNMSIFLT